MATDLDPALGGPTRSRTRTHRLLATLATATFAGLTLSACGGSTGPTDPASSAPSAISDHGSMSGMGDMAATDGVAAKSAGFRFAPVVSEVPADQAALFQFRILAADGTPVTVFEPDQTKLMHFYLVRSDLTGFQHVHPSVSADGLWTAALAPATPGSYRAYTSFIVKGGAGAAAVPLVLGHQLTVPGPATPTAALPAPSVTTGVDGYTLTLDADQLMAGMDRPVDGYGVQGRAAGDRPAALPG